MLIQKSFLFILFASFAQLVFAQEQVSEFLPDRPGLSPFPSRLEKGMLALETGFGRTKIKSDSGDDLNRFVSTQLRYGLLANMELNLGLTYRNVEANSNTIDSTFKGMDATTLGARFRIAEEHGLFPQMECHGQLRLPYFGNEAFIPGDVEPSFDLNFLHRVSDSFRLTYGFGMFWRGPDENGFYGMKLSKFFNRSNGLFLEHYSYLRGNGKNEAHLAAGYMLWLGERIQFDTSLDFGKQKELTFVTFSIGCSTLLTGK
jgi:hypothetical protein